MRFSGWPELKEMFLGRPKDMPVTFILAPMAMALRAQGVKIKIVYLGHRDGSAVMVHKDSGIFPTADRRGKTVAVPGRYANQRLIFYRELKKVGLTLDDINIVDMPPPDIPAALLTRSVDAITSGEPFMGQTELDGYGRTLWQAKDVWPGFISCVLAEKLESEIVMAEPTGRHQTMGGGDWVEPCNFCRGQGACGWRRATSTRESWRESEVPYSSSRVTPVKLWS